MQEDHVSMGWSAARKLRTAVDNLARIIAVELVVAARAIEIRTQGSEVLEAAAASRAVVRAVREAGVPGVGPDRFLAPDLAAAHEFVTTGLLAEAAESVTGPLA
jgi:histidine ammonia-lyase